MKALFGNGTGWVGSGVHCENGDDADVSGGSMTKNGVLVPEPMPDFLNS